MEFLSTPSARRATRYFARNDDGNGFLSTPSARRATKTDTAVTISYTISIHALREEGDQLTNGKRAAIPISIHALREEGDLQTPFIQNNLLISIHALREEGDT